MKLIKVFLFFSVVARLVVRTHTTDVICDHIENVS